MKMRDFVGKRKIFFIVSAALIVLTILASFLLGVNLDIQFKGGSILTYSYTGEIDKNEFESTVKSVVSQSVNVQEQKDIITGKNNLVVSLTGNVSMDSEELTKLTDALAAKYPDNQLETSEINNVDPVIGKEFFAKCLVAVAFSCVIMILYIGVRFRKIGGWQAGVTSVVALIHDLIIVYATFVFCKIPINDNFIAVVLTILGYSINATIVIYDRVRENKRLYGSKLTIDKLMNLSITQTLKRTLTTTASTIIALLVICVAGFIYNINSIITFALPMIVGTISGTYSSLCLAGSLWVVWQENMVKKKKAKT